MAAVVWAMLQKPLAAFPETGEMVWPCVMVHSLMVSPSAYLSYDVADELAEAFWHRYRDEGDPRAGFLRPYVPLVVLSRPEVTGALLRLPGGFAGTVH